MLFLVLLWWSLIMIHNVFLRLNELTNLRQWQDRHQLLWSNAELIRDYLYSLKIDGSNNSFIKAYVDDALARFFHSIDMLSGFTLGKVLEIGANPYLFTVLIKQLYDCELILTNFFNISVYDEAVGNGQQIVRSDKFNEKYIFDYYNLNVELSTYPFLPETFDTILFCEILEHIIVDPIQSFKKLYQILKPGGIILLTTPNAVRLINFAHMLAGKNFFDRYHPQNGIYGRHNREFTLTEVSNFLKQEGFIIEKATTLDRYNYDLLSMYVDSYEEQTKLPWTGTQLRNILTQIKAETENRGDNLYVIARKPLE